MFRFAQNPSSWYAAAIFFCSLAVSLAVQKIPFTERINAWALRTDYFLEFKIREIIARPLTDGDICVLTCSTFAGPDGAFGTLGSQLDEAVPLFLKKLMAAKPRVVAIAVQEPQFSKRVLNFFCKSTDQGKLQENYSDSDLTAPKLNALGKAKFDQTTVVWKEANTAQDLPLNYWDFGEQQCWLLKPSAGVHAIEPAFWPHRVNAHNLLVPLERNRYLPCPDLEWDAAKYGQSTVLLQRIQRLENAVVTSLDRLYLNIRPVQYTVVNANDFLGAHFDINKLKDKIVVCASPFLKESFYIESGDLDQRENWCGGEEAEAQRSWLLLSDALRTILHKEPLGTCPEQIEFICVFTLASICFLVQARTNFRQSLIATFIILVGASIGCDLLFHAARLFLPLGPLLMVPPLSLIVFSVYRIDRWIRERAREVATLKAIEQTQEDERKELSGKLHDNVIPNINQIARLGRELDEAGNPLGKKLRDLANESERAARATMDQLYPAALFELGLAPALEQLLYQVTKEQQSAVHFENEFGADRFSTIAPDNQYQIYMIVKTLINNSMLHAQAATIKLKMKNDNGVLSIHVLDNGVGFDIRSSVKPASRGLRICCMRAERIRATILWRKPEEHQGTEVILSIPLS